MRISDWSSDVCSSDLLAGTVPRYCAGSAIAFPLLVLSRWQWRDLRARHLNTGFQSTKHAAWSGRSEEHTSELQSLMRNSYAVFCLKKKNQNNITNDRTHITD